MPKNDPKKEKELPEITDSGLNEFVDKLLNRIADESDEGRKAFLLSMDAAQILYKKPMESWLTGWIYKYSRVRGPEIEKTMKSIEAFPDAYTRLQDIKLLVETKGEWHPDSSYNYYLFVELINSVPGYKPLDKELVYPITIKIKDKVLEQIDSFMSQYKANQQLIASRERELAATRQSMKKSVDHVLIFDNLEEAQVSAKKNPAQIHFCLTSISKVWYLSWIDSTGKAYKLYPTDELISLLVDQKAEKEEQLNLIHMEQLKKECIKARDIFLDKVQLRVNPRNPATHMPLNNESLIATGVSATFVLRGKSNNYSLHWVSTVGKAIEIPLERYPQFKVWLDSQSTIGDEQLPQLKAYLLNVNTTQALVGMDEFKKQLKECLTGGPKSPESSVMTEKALPKRINMTLFANIEKCEKEKNGARAQVIKESKQTVEPVIGCEELIDSKGMPDSEKKPLSPKISQLQEERYACLMQLPLFNQKTKQVVEPVDELRSGLNPVS